MNLFVYRVENIFVIEKELYPGYKKTDLSNCITYDTLRTNVYIYLFIYSILFSDIKNKRFKKRYITNSCVKVNETKNLR